MPLVVRATTTDIISSIETLSGTGSGTSAGATSTSAHSTVTSTASSHPITTTSASSTPHTTSTTSKHQTSALPTVSSASSSGLSGGTIAGIIIAAGLGVGLVVGLAVFCFLRRRKQAQGRGRFSKLDRSMRTSTIEELDDFRSSSRGLIAPVYVRERERGYGHVQHPSFSAEPLLVPIPVPRSTTTPTFPSGSTSVLHIRSPSTPLSPEVPEVMVGGDGLLGLSYEDQGRVDPYTRIGTILTVASPDPSQRTVALPPADGTTLSPVVIAQDSPSRPMSAVSQYSQASAHHGFDLGMTAPPVPPLPSNLQALSSISDASVPQPQPTSMKTRPTVLAQLLKARAEAGGAPLQRPEGEESQTRNGRERSNTFASISAFSPDEEENQARSLAEAEWKAGQEERQRLRIRTGGNQRGVEEVRMAYSDDEDSEPGSPDSMYSQLSATTTVQEHFAYLDLSSTFSEGGSGNMARRRSSKRKSFRRRQAMSPVPEVPDIPPSAFLVPTPLPSLSSPQPHSIDLPLLSSTAFGKTRTSVADSAKSSTSNSNSNSNYSSSASSRYPSLASKSSSGLHQQYASEPAVPNWRNVPGGLDALKNLQVPPMHNPHSPSPPATPRSPPSAGPRSPGPLGPRSLPLVPPRRQTSPMTHPDALKPGASSPRSQAHLRSHDQRAHSVPEVDRPKEGLEQGGIASIDITL